MGFKSDIEIAQETVPVRINEIADRLGIPDDSVENYGRYKAKIDYNILKDKKDTPDGKLILVTAITPTPAGEGKTTTSVGLTDALNRIGKKSVAALREPSLGPVFGIKGVRQAAAMHRSSRWRTSTCILPEIFMPSERQTTCLRQ